MAQMTERTRGKVPLARIAGIEVNLDYSWFIIFFLVLWALTFGYFPFYYPGQRRLVYWIVGGASTILLFFSILFHEFMHSLTARRAGIRIPEITLFIFGGVSRVAEDARDPLTELRIALAGPLSSFFLALVFWILEKGVAPAGSLFAVMLSYLSWINLILGVFNLIPGFPLDGGRVLRALWWKKTGSLMHATRVASDIGKGFAWAIVIVGGIQIFTGGLFGGLWLILIGMFMRGIAERGYQELVIKQSLQGIRVEEVMMHDVVSVPSDISVTSLINDYFFKYCYRGFPVVRGGTVAGIVNLADIKEIPENERWGKRTQDVMIPMNEDISIKPEASLAEALQKMNLMSISRLLVVRGTALMGMISKGGLMRFLEMKNILQR